MEGKHLCRKCLCARESREWGETKKKERSEKRGREIDSERVNESSRREKNKTSHGGAQGPKGHQLRGSPNSEEVREGSLRGVRPLNDKGKHCRTF